MLDFDFVCSRPEPSVAAMVYPFTGDHKQKFYWGHKEILVPGRLWRNMATLGLMHLYVYLFKVSLFSVSRII